jgi:hypothetical protein
MYIYIYIYIYVFMCHILCAEGFFGAAMILSSVREVNSCSSIYVVHPSFQCCGSIQIL